MLKDSESVKEDIVLWTDAKTVSDLIHVVPDVITIDDCCTSCWCVETWERRGVGGRQRGTECQCMKRGNVYQ